MNSLVQLLSSDNIKKLQALLGMIATIVIAACPPQTIAYKIALAFTGVLSSHAMLSTGVARKADLEPETSKEPS